ncbi:signal transduction histidine kinase [Altererythrobacter atlanticus]|uniref:histidine kinase n=1 Tax=Croceibacterium atlanticum TaxID=1267766 RepID=A0A0F7KQW3_9SPHN|nr:HAMP domain-containing sensor histidine kinase [Croceibacterium atlanticum]AKH42878.1 Virulence sensor histidine kinase PhoQ [Croceibacterium atlanticum]MBB5731658.1 signal transduction histidine kinase [Croceibacterium atlanticum]
MKLAQISTGSLRLRFLLAVMLWVALGVAGIWFTATRVFERHIEQMYHEELEVHVRELARLTELDGNGRPRLMRPLSDPRYEVPLSGFYWQVGVPGRAPLLSESMTRGRLDMSVAHSPDIAHKVERGPTGPAITYGLMERGPDGEEIHIVIATDQSELDDDIASFTNELSVWLLALAALLFATGLAIISFGLRPLARLREAITQLRSARVQKLEGRYPSEIAPLVTDLNEYIRQNGEIVARARVQAGNLAHSLRTPLAIVTDEAERLVQRESCASSGRVLLDQAEAMQQQIDYQLARARSAAGARVPGSRAMLPELAVPILNAMRRLHPDKAFELDAPADPVTIPADPVNLSELLSILLDNAGKWAKSQVTMAIGMSDQGQLTIRIEDNGPGMNEDQIARAFEVGTRFDPAMPGSGLGLAMARDICENLGARLELRRAGSGLTAIIYLPA